MGNTNCCSEAGDVDNKSVGKISQPIKENHPSVYVDRVAGNMEKPVKLNINPTSFGVSGFRVQTLGLKLLPGVHALVQRHGLFSWLPVSPGFNAGLPVYRARMTDGNYVGQMQNGIRQGKGYLQKSNGDLAACTFENGIPDGRGAIYFASGDYFDGTLDEGETREGKIIYIDESYYIGEMSGDGFMNGYGTFYDRDGNTRFEGNWNNNIKIINGQR